jgi:tight adherence protein B
MAPLIGGLFLLALLLLAGAIWVLRFGQRAALKSRVGHHFRRLTAFPLDLAGPHQLRPPLIERWLWRSGIRLTPRLILGMLGATLLAAILSWYAGGPMATTTVLAGLAAGAVIWPHLQYRKRAVVMASQIPLFLDQMVRALATGRNLDGALRLASQESRPPLGDAMARVQQVVDLGEDISEALRDAARLYDLKELHFVALAVRIGHGYGSNPKEMLESAAKMVRDREQAHRELRALTGETRVSAWILSILPSALALYMVAVNPDYINNMWLDPTGRVVLLLALALQATGVVILWRMVKSV